MKKRILASVLAMLLIMAVSTSALAATRWIKTGNGKPAVGREGPSKDYNVLTYLGYGTIVNTVGSSENGYTPVQMPGGSDTAYVLTKFLAKGEPDQYVPSQKTATVPAPRPVFRAPSSASSTRQSLSARIMWLPIISVPRA